MTTLTFDEAVKEIKTASTRGAIELFNPETNTTKEIPLWKADVALVQNDGVVLVGGLRFRNNGQRGVEML